MFNSGKLKVLQNRELKNSLFSWTSNLQEVKEVEARTLDIRGQFHNYLADKIPLADLFILDRIGPKFNFKSNFKVNHKVILSDLRFENILSSRSFWQTMLLNRYHLTEENIEKILRMIEEDIKH